MSPTSGRWWWRSSRLRGQRLVLEAAPDFQRLDGFRHVVDADDLRTLLDRLHRQREAAGEALVGGCFVRQGADEALAAGTEYDRAAEAVEQREAVQQLEIVSDRLAEADARIDQDIGTRDARRFGGGDAL